MANLFIVFSHYPKITFVLLPPLVFSGVPHGPVEPPVGPMGLH